MPIVSVVIPAYEARDVLPRAVESVRSQTLTDIEVIVVEDGSVEDASAYVEGLDDDRVRYVAHETNRGASAARNTGLAHATGRYVAFLDADDEWRPTKLERQVARLERRSTDWVAAYCGVETVFPTTTSAVVTRLARILSRRRRTTGAEGGRTLIGDVLADDLHTSAGSTLVVRREVAERIGGFDESFDRFQDPEFLVRVLREGKLAAVDEPLVRRHESPSPPADLVRRADEHYLETFAETVERLEREGRDVVGAHHYLLAKCYLREGRFRTGLGYLATARHPELSQLPGLVRDGCTGLARRLTSPRPDRG